MAAAHTLVLDKPIDLRDATSARFVVESWLSADSSVGAVEVRVDGVYWGVLQTVAASEGWQPIEIDLTRFCGHVLELQFRLQLLAPSTAGSADVWSIGPGHLNVVH